MINKTKANRKGVVPERILVFSVLFLSAFLYTACKQLTGIKDDFSSTTFIDPIILPDDEYLEGDTVSFQITASDSNAAIPISMSSSYLNPGMTLVKLSDGLWEFTWDTDDTDAGVYAIRFTATGNGQTRPEWVHFTVNDANPGEPVTTFFESSFETATGTSSAARLDGGKWDSFNGGGLEYIEVISELDTIHGTIQPVDGNNMLSIGTNGGAWENVKKEGFFRPDDEHTYLRFYMCVLPPTDTELASMHHGIQDYNCDGYVGFGANNVWVYHFDFTADTWQTGMAFRNMGEDLDMDYFGNGLWIGDGMQQLYTSHYPGGLGYYKWYRFEIHVHWLGVKSTETPAIVEFRVYDGTTLVVDNNSIGTHHYEGIWNFELLSLDDLYSFDNDAEGRRVYINATCGCIMFGTNGALEMPDMRTFYLLDKVAFSSEGWIGE